MHLLASHGRRGTRALSVGAAIVAACGLALLLLAAPAQAAFPGGNGKIAFETNRDGDLEIFDMDPDGGNENNLTENDDDDFEPAYSANGKKIAFAQFDGNDDEIWKMDADGSDLRQLTDNDDKDSDPAWSPNGNKIAFDSDRDGDGEIFKMDANGSDQDKLTDERRLEPTPTGRRTATRSPSRATATATARSSRWTPTGATRTTSRRTTTTTTSTPTGRRTATRSPSPATATATTRSSRWTPTGATSRTSATTTEKEEDPAWSPNGNKIAFASEHRGQHRDLQDGRQRERPGQADQQRRLRRRPGLAAEAVSRPSRGSGQAEPNSTKTQLAASSASPTSVPSEEERRRRRWAVGWGASEADRLGATESRRQGRETAAAKNPDCELNGQGGGDEGEPYRRS